MLAYFSGKTDWSFLSADILWRCTIDTPVLQHQRIWETWTAIAVERYVYAELLALVLYAICTRHYISMVDTTCRGRLTPSCVLKCFTQNGVSVSSANCRSVTSLSARSSTHTLQPVAIYKGITVAVTVVAKAEVNLTRQDFIDLVNVSGSFILFSINFCRHNVLCRETVSYAEDTALHVMSYRRLHCVATRIYGAWSK